LDRVAFHIRARSMHHNRKGQSGVAQKALRSGVTERLVWMKFQRHCRCRIKDASVVVEACSSLSVRLCGTSCLDNVVSASGGSLARSNTVLRNDGCILAPLHQHVQDRRLKQCLSVFAIKNT